MGVRSLRDRLSCLSSGAKRLRQEDGARSRAGKLYRIDQLITLGQTVGRPLSHRHLLEMPGRFCNPLPGPKFRRDRRRYKISMRRFSLDQTRTTGEADQRLHVLYVSRPDL